MPDVHVPRVDDQASASAPIRPEATAGAPHRSKGPLQIALEVLLIATGVFLGLMGEQWREHLHERQLATEALQRFRAEILANREAVAKVKDYHASTKADLTRYFDAAPKDRAAVGVRVRGLQPVFFARTAWDLAIATQALAYTDPQLAFALSRVYTLQQDYADLTRGAMQAMYVRTPTDNEEQFLGSVNVYYGDIVLWEPRLLEMYDELVPQLDRALGDSGGRPAPGS